MARTQRAAFLLAILALAYTRSAFCTEGLIDAALQAKSEMLQEISGKGTTSQTTLIGYGQGSSVPRTPETPSTPSTPSTPVPPPNKPPVTPPNKPPVTPPSKPPVTPSTPQIHIGHVTSVTGGQPTAKNQPGGKGDPIMTGFDLRPFEFMGEPGMTYNLISEQSHQVSTKLKVGVMWDHNGTYMEGFGFQYRNQQVTIEIDEHDELTVTMNGKQLELPQSEADLEVIPYVELGEFLLLWQRHREGLGNAIELTTDLLQVVVWLTPAGTLDDGGVEQPAYLNFDVFLLGPPSGNEMQGVIGESYKRMLAGEAIQDPEHPLYLPSDFKFHGIAEHYVVDGYFGEHRYNLFGKGRAKRQLFEADTADIVLPAQHSPLRAKGGAPWIKQAVEAFQETVAKHASGGRKGRFL